MSVQFGRWNFDGAPVNPEHLEKVSALLLPYAPDGTGTYQGSSVGMVFGALCTTKEARRESQPHVSRLGHVFAWDGRLDNRADLIPQLPHTVTAFSTDVEIVAAAYEHWGFASFGKLVGDWALSVLDARKHELLLAKDCIGNRQLYYVIDENHISWSTILDPLVLLASRSFPLCEEYVAGWFSQFPAAHLTPYTGIHSVPPSSFVTVRAGRAVTSCHWQFNTRSRIRYRTDEDYEEHFRTVFGESIRRRLRSDSPILAELSGGMDSSSIVCMADQVMARGLAETLRLDTISYYNDSEPNWNEREYFARVEEKRGRVGCHINVGALSNLPSEYAMDFFAASPGSGKDPTEASQQFIGYLTSQGHRVILSGIGGDETLGGVPTGVPELADLLTRGHLFTLAHRLLTWALVKRTPLLYLVAEIVRGFLPVGLVGMPERRKPPAWLEKSFVKAHRAALIGYETRMRVFGPPPSFQENLTTLEVLRRQIACSGLSAEPPYDKTFPYLDRDLLEFLCSIPRTQLVTPGRRRSLMRRALGGIVPTEVLERRRKAFVARAPLFAMSAGWPALIEMTEHMLSGSLGIVNCCAFADALRTARQGQEVRVVAMLRTIAIEYWLRHARDWNVLRLSTSVRETRQVDEEEARAV